MIFVSGTNTTYTFVILDNKSLVGLFQGHMSFETNSNYPKTELAKEKCQSVQTYVLIDVFNPMYI